MNIFDIVAIAITGLWFFIGFVKGFLDKFLKIIIVLVSAGAAYVYYKNGGSMLGITITFAAVNIVLHVLFWGAKSMLLKNKKVSLVSRMAGGLIGGLEGAVLVLLALVLLHLLNGILGGKNPVLAKNLDTSFLYERYRAISMASNLPAVKEIYRIGEALKAKEGKIILDEQAVSRLRENASLKAMLEDKQLTESIKRGDYGKIISNLKFFNILNDVKLLKQLWAAAIKENRPAATEDRKIQIIVPEPENRLEGIVYAQGSAAAIINDEVYQMGSRVFGGKIVRISKTSLTLEFPDGNRQYSIGDAIP